MSTRSLSLFFKPRSIAVVGASDRLGSFGGFVLENLIRGGFEGELLAINSGRYRTVRGKPCYRKVAKLPLVPDLAIICTPPKTIPGLVRDLGKKGVKAALVLMGGMSGTLSRSGRPLKESALEAARPYGLRLMGPNCLGVLVPGRRMNASYAHKGVSAGKVAFVGQSAMLGAAVLDWAGGRGSGFSHFLTLGDSIDVDLADVIDYLAADRDTKAILLQVEALSDGAKFLASVRAASRSKLVLAARGVPLEDTTGTPPGLANRDAVWHEVLKRAGVFEVPGLDELFEALEMLANLKPPTGSRLAIIGNGAGPVALAADRLRRHGGATAALAADTLAKIAALLPFPPTGGAIDLNADANPVRYAKVLELLDRDPDVDAILVLHVPTPIAPAVDYAHAVVAQKPQRQILTSWMGLASVGRARAALAMADIPTYDNPDKAVRAFMARVRHQHNEELMTRTPPPLPDVARSDHERAARILTAAADQGRSFLSAPEAHELIAAAGIPFAPTAYATDVAGVPALFDRFNAPVALKCVHDGNCRPFPYEADPAFFQRSVVRGLTSAPACAEAAAKLLSRAQGGVQGFVVQEMRHAPDTILVNLGVTRDPHFGPLLLFGEGGNPTDVARDRGIGLPPLNLLLARELIAGSRLMPLLSEGRHGQARIDHLARFLVYLSRLIIAFPQIASLEINPFLVVDETLLALDAAVILGPPVLPAILPYPDHLCERATLRKSARCIELRPIRGEDEPAHEAFSRRLSAEAVRFRFFHSVTGLSHKQLARLTQVDYDREMAFIASAIGENGEPETLGVVRSWTDADNISSEFAIIIRNDQYGEGLGRMLAEKMIAYTRQRGTLELTGTVLPENERMLGLAKNLGFTIRFDREEGAMEVRLQLNPPANDWQAERLARRSEV